MEYEEEDAPEIPVDMGPPPEGYNTPGDAQRIRAEFVSDMLKWEGYHVPVKTILKVLSYCTFDLQLDNTGSAVEALRYLDYTIDPDSDEPISLARYKLSQRFN